jgi:mono/diheme cytochrome c family protein
MNATCHHNTKQENHNWRTTMRIVLTTLTLACLSGAVASAADAKAGQAIYDKSCKSCHGPDGAANPAVAKMMKVDMQDLKSAEVQAMGDDDIKKIIAGGKGKMRPVASVSGHSADDVVAYIRTLKK